MGGRPLIANSILAFPPDDVSPEVVAEMASGAMDILMKCGCLLAGGHTVVNSQPLYGFAVIGEVHPTHLKTNFGARPGDKLLLTKKIGSGIYSNALKAGLLGDDLYQEFVRVITHVNLEGESLGKYDAVHAMTDLTGFGVLGHCVEMASNDEVELTLYADQVPKLPDLLELSDMLSAPSGGAKRNLKAYSAQSEFVGEWTLDEKLIFSDPQTNGGLLIAVDAASEADIKSQLKASFGCEASTIGEFRRAKKDNPWLRSKNSMSAEGPHFIFVIACLGTITGFLSGLIGLGGGIVMVPMLYYVPPVLGLKPLDVYTIMGITSVQSLFGTIASSCIHARFRKVCLPRVLWMGGTMAACGFIGSFFSVYLSQKTILIVFIATALVACVLSLLPAKSDLQEEEPPLNLPPTLGVGAVVGGISGIIGQGGAFAYIPAMTNILHIPMRAAIASAAWLGLPTAFIVLVGRIANKTVPFSVVPWLIPGILCGSWIGARFSQKIPQAVLRRILAGVIICSVIRMCLDMAH